MLLYSFKSTIVAIVGPRQAGKSTLAWLERRAAHADRMFDHLLSKTLTSIE